MLITDISGQWDVFTDESKKPSLPESFPMKITLPNTTSNARLGKQCGEKNYGCLTDLYHFEGYAWFRRTIEISPQMSKQHITLFLERTRKTAVYIDGKKIGTHCSLCAPHRYRLDGIKAGKHELVILVDNTDYPTGGGHLTSRDTQTNWNGITGRIELRSFDIYPETVYVLPNISDNSVHIRAEIIGAEHGFAQLFVTNGGVDYGKSTEEFINGILDCTLKLSQPAPLWSEFKPQLLSLCITIGEDMRVVRFGMRELKADGKKLRINGAETFLRGKHDGLIYPKTGFAPTETSAWVNIFSIAKSYGINHYRFHTCCPPEAAFEAADLMGIYLQPELPFWGTVPEEFGEEHNFLRSEGFSMLREFGSHPSFAMMSMGNELWGSKERLNELIEGYKKVAPDKLYSGGSNNFQFVPCVLEQEDFFSGVRLGHDRLIRGSYAMCDAPQGHIQTDRPNSIHNYDPLIDENSAAGNSAGGEIMIQYGTEMRKVRADNTGELVPNVPIISHEVGQYVIYPDYEEIKKYTGSLRHDTYALYRETAEKNGLLPYSRDFFRASGALAVDCYRADIETALRSSLMSGFQLLDLQDFTGQGTATVGILNAFMESKGLISPEKWRQFCDKTVVLAELNKFVFTSGERVDFGILISNTNPAFRCSSVKWELIGKNGAVERGESEVFGSEGRITRMKSAGFTYHTDSPVQLTLALSAGDIRNEYKLYFYPETDVEITENGITRGGRTLDVTHDIAQAKNGAALYIPLAKEDSLEGSYCTDFWCYGMFKSISESMNRRVPIGTLGLLINPDSPLLAGFPCESFTTPQWYDIVSHSHSAELTADIVPDVWVIDNPQRAKRLGLLWREGSAVCCSARLWEVADSVAVKHFAASVFDCLMK
ncbi:MAG: hypothetical protein ACI4KM_00700 [Oscillospiraceae bacterium]